MKKMNLNAIDTIINDKGNFSINLSEEYLSGLIGLEDFSYINIL